VSQSRQSPMQTNEISVKEGQLHLAELTIAGPAKPAAVKVTCAGKPVDVSYSSNADLLRISFSKAPPIRTNQTLTVRTTE